ncbi:MAG: hypothetical protein OEZ45_13675, partial [Candidatus Aminicenantes bacterium]|nr:hypothetical protein [Candidatus Aminicenantes bacterium]
SSYSRPPPFSAVCRSFYRSHTNPLLSSTSNIFLFNARAIGFLQNLFAVKKLFTSHSFYIEVVEEDNK